MNARAWVGTTAIGLATGARSFSGIAALTLSSRDGLLARSRVRRAVTLAAAGEVVGDKLPVAPSRLTFPALQSRLLSGAVCGMLIARRTHSAIAPAAAVGAAAAFAGAHAGAAWRSRAPFDADWPAAVLEDTVTYGLAATAAYLSS